jgi:oligopeptide/dipeptide ABC transporter ATP-binding protein
LSDPLVLAEGLSVEYAIGGSVTRALDQVSIEIGGKGDSIGLVGESGSGKTTLGMSLMNLIEPPGKIVSGRVDFNRRNVLEMNSAALREYRWRQVAMVFQSAMNSLSPVKKASDHIVEVLVEHLRVPKSEAREKALSLLSEVGIESEYADAYPHELSGGMRQRVVIALALALSPRLMIADEPTSALDVVVQKQILSLLQREVAQRDLSLLFVTHDIPILRGLVNRVAVMFAGEVVENGEAGRIFSEPLHPYTEELLGSLVTLDLEDMKMPDVAAERRSLEHVASVGCKYRNRCKYAFERCRTERPALRELENGRLVACHKYR